MPQGVMYLPLPLIMTNNLNLQLNLRPRWSQLLVAVLASVCSSYKFFFEKPTTKDKVTYITFVVIAYTCCVVGKCFYWCLVQGSCLPISISSNRFHFTSRSRRDRPQQSLSLVTLRAAQRYNFLLYSYQSREYKDRENGDLIYTHAPILPGQSRDVYVVLIGE